MSDRENVSPEASEAIVDRAADALRREKVPDGPPAEVLAAVVAAGTNVDQPAKPTIRERIFTMNRIAKIAAAVILVAAIAAVLIWPTDGNGPTSIAFGEVKRQIQEAQTISFKLHMKMPGTGKAVTIKNYYAPGRMRQEMVEMGVVTVFDMNAGKSVTLNAKAKLAIITDVGNLDDIKAIKEKQGDPLTDIRKMMEGENKDLGEKEIDGQPAKGYQVTKGGFVMDLWVDPETGYPIRMEMDSPLGKGERIILTDFVLNAKLDEKLFSLEIPEGYTVKTVEMDLGDTSEEDLVTGLRILAKYNDGKFPKLPMDFGVVQKLQEADISPEERQQFGKVFARMMVFVAKTMQGSEDYKYFGEGVELGAKDTPIAWWRPKGADNYRVVYGDLRIEDVAPKDLPEKPTTAPKESPEAPAAAE
ncbi:MAG TPA: hypothetical protein VM098_07670 [Phycisphaerae bacterium]|nr:hypothetical protein [Phycisphaerae bacterium]